MREASKGGRDTSEEDLVLQVKNSELVYKLCIVMRRNVLFDRSMAERARKGRNEAWTERGKERRD